MINVLYVIWSLDLGGAERVVINLAKGLDKTKFNSIVCCLNGKGRFAGELEDEGIKVIALNKKKKIEVSIIRRLMQVMIEEDIQIVHTHLWGANFWGRVAAKQAKVPVIIATEHNLDVWKTPLHFIADRWLSRCSDKIIAVSKSVKEFYISKGIAPEKIEVIYNGVELTESPSHQVTKSPVRQEFDIKNDEKVMAIVGRLVPQKGHRYLFEALSSLNGRCKFKLLVVGDGPLRRELELLVASYQLSDKVVFMGMRRDVPELLKAIDILVMPSLREGLSLIALEAMAAGVPVVATKVGGTPEVVVDEETGLLVKAQDGQRLRESLERLITDKELAARLGRNGAERVRSNFSVEKMAQETERLYLGFLSGENY